MLVSNMENRPSYFEQDDLDEKVAALLTERADRGPKVHFPQSQVLPLLRRRFVLRWTG